MTLVRVGTNPGAPSSRADSPRAKVGIERSSRAFAFAFPFASVFAFAFLSVIPAGDLLVSPGVHP